MIDKLGIICITVVGFQITRFLFRFIYNNFLGVSLGINAVNLRNMGKWAVITGATDGIGKAYAEELARRGFNIVLISRTQSKLDDVAANLEKSYNIETKTIVADFTEPESIYYDIEKQLAGLDIGVLINNVGMSYPYPELFLDQPMTNMSKIVLAGMLDRRRGVIVNVSSTAAEIPSPMLTVYAASKAYVEKFTSNLSTEYSKHGIIFQCLLPGYVATKMSKIRSSTWMAPSPKTYVKKAIKTIGVLEHTTGYYPHTLLISVINTLMYVAPSLAQKIIMKTMQNIRSRAIRKKNNTT